MSSTSITVGWDVGGAHLKAVAVDIDGVALTVIQLPCPLWGGLEELHKAMDEMLERLGPLPARHVVTMTGELSDVFKDRLQGVAQITEIMVSRLGSGTKFYAGAAGLVGIHDVTRHAATIASANWLASAAFIAQKVEQGVLMDIGSTTTDIISLKDGRSLHQGVTDAERMRVDELVYTGVVRTPLMALGSHVEFEGGWHGVAAEHFATTADIYRLTGDLDDSEDMSDTADGDEKTVTGSARRIARMIGHDFNDAPEAAWIGLSRTFKRLQLNRLENAVLRCLSRNLVDGHALFIGAGAGSFLVRELAQQLGREYMDAETFIKVSIPEQRRWASVCLPAYALACLGLSI